MRRSDLYLGRQVFSGTVMAVILLSVVLLMGVVFKEIRELLVRYQAPPKLIAQFLLYSLPYPLMFTLPWGFLATVLLTFSRLSSQNELVGFRTSGVSLIRLSLPVFTLGLFFSLICWFLAGELSPLSKRYTYRLPETALEQDPIALLKPNAVQTRLPGHRLFVTGKDGNQLKGFHLYQLSEDSRDALPETYVYAKSVKLAVDRTENQFLLSFADAFIERQPEPGDTPEVITASTAEPWPIGLPSAGQRRQKVSHQSNRTLFSQLGNQDTEEDQSSILLELQKRHALSLACLSFAFIGIPLGITSQRRENTSGLIISIIIAGLYFASLSLAENFEETPLLSTSLMWLPNLACIALGVVLLRRASHR